MNEPTAHNRGKPTAIARIRQRNPYNTIIMIGDGITDLEAVQVRGLARVCYARAVQGLLAFTDLEAVLVGCMITPI
jgi:2-hydroxy-3-keto-5-methylthiopentenyl-1-phosphate phosphatase